MLLAYLHILPPSPAPSPTSIQIQYYINLLINLCSTADAIGMALGETFKTPVGGSEETNGIVVLLDTRSPDDGQFLGIEVNVERDGCISIQVSKTYIVTINDLSA